MSFESISRSLPLISSRSGLRNQRSTYDYSLKHSFAWRRSSLTCSTVASQPRSKSKALAVVLRAALMETLRGFQLLRLDISPGVKPGGLLQ